MTRPVDTGRRDFLKTSAMATAATTLTAVPFVHAQQGSDVLKIGLIGCGGRGTGAALNALQADPHVRLTAMGDAFSDRLESSLAGLRRNDAVAAKIDVPPEKRFVGFDAYQQVIDSGVDVVLLCTPPHFRPAHLEAAVEAGKHIFCEKPVAVDAPGVRRVLAACQDGPAAPAERRLRPVLALSRRHARNLPPHSRRRRRRHRGPAMQLQHRPALAPRPPARLERHGMADAQLALLHLAVRRLQRRAAHSQPRQDDLGHARSVPPVRCVGLGGRQVRTGPEFGHIFDHMACVYEFADGVKCFSSCRQQAGCANEVKDYVMGTQGKVRRHGRTRSPAGTPGVIPPTSAAATTCIRTSTTSCSPASAPATPINNGDYMCKSTLMAIMGRMACYTGQAITWEQAHELA